MLRIKSKYRESLTSVSLRIQILEYLLNARPLENLANSCP